MKTYFIMLSQRFLSGHPREGEPTGFRMKFNMCQEAVRGLVVTTGSRHKFAYKYHTIRSGYTRWEKCLRDVQQGKAVLSVREWAERPFNSRHNIIKDLAGDNGVGIQKLIGFEGDHALVMNDAGQVVPVDLVTLARNDGLSLEDFRAWFRDAQPTAADPFAIIHFTPFRY